MQVLVYLAPQLEKDELKRISANCCILRDTAKLGFILMSMIYKQNTGLFLFSLHVLIVFWRN